LTKDTKQSEAFINILNRVQSIIWLGAIFWIIFNYKNSEPYCVLFLLEFVGGFIFHIAWEVKAQYALPYVVMIIPYCVKGYADVANKIEHSIRCRIAIKEN